MERRDIVGKRLLLLLSNFRAAGGKSIGLEVPSPQRMEEGVSEFFETTAPDDSLERSGRGNVQDLWYAGGCAHPGHVRSLSSIRRNDVTQTFEFLGTDGGWSPKLGDTVVLPGFHREKQNWRGRLYDQCRLETMSMDGGQC